MSPYILPCFAVVSGRPPPAYFFCFRQAAARAVSTGQNVTQSRGVCLTRNHEKPAITAEAIIKDKVEFERRQNMLAGQRQRISDCCHRQTCNAGKCHLAQYIVDPLAYRLFCQAYLFSATNCTATKDDMHSCAGLQPHLSWGLAICFSSSTASLAAIFVMG